MFCFVERYSGIISSEEKSGYFRERLPSEMFDC